MPGPGTVIVSMCGASSGASVPSQWVIVCASLRAYASSGLAPAAMAASASESSWLSRRQASGDAASIQYARLSPTLVATSWSPVTTTAASVVEGAWM